MSKPQTQEPSEYKALPALGLKITDEDKGIVEHLISVFGVTDLGGDVCHPGAFTKTLLERADRIRVLDAHNRGSVLNAIGIPLQLKELSRVELPAKVLEKWPEATGGLWAETQFLLDTPEGKGAFARIKAGAVKEFSFGYNTLDEDFTEDPEGIEVRNLRTLRLWEYGPVLFGMNPAAQVTGVKDTATDPPPVSKDGESKPAPDVTENTIRIRVKDPGLFQEGSFRTISIDKNKGIQAVIGRPEGKTTTEVQSYIFDKSKWDVERARKWVSEHKKALVILVLEEKALSYTRMESVVREAFNDEYNPREGPYDYWVREVYDEYVIVEASKARECYQVSYAFKNGDMTFSSKGEWVIGEFVFVEKRKEAGKRILQLVEIEQAQFELALEAGPD